MVNIHSLAMALQSNNFRARMFVSIQRVTQKGWNVDHVNNRHGKPFLRITCRYGRLNFWNEQGKQLNRAQVFKLLQGKEL